MSWLIIMSSEECKYRRKPLLRSARCLHPDNKGTTRAMEMGFPDRPPCDEKLCPIAVKNSKIVKKQINKSF